MPSFTVVTIKKNKQNIFSELKILYYKFKSQVISFQIIVIFNFFKSFFLGYIKCKITHEMAFC
jgi:hypothetical protein